MENKKLASYQQNQNRGQKIKLEITKYIRYWPFILGVLFISLSVVFVQLRYTKKMYQSNAKIRILSNSKGLELPEAGFIFSKPNINLENNIEIECLPGPTAFVPALVVSGLPIDKFIFEGFLPAKKGRKSRLEKLALESRTMVFYESPHKLFRTLLDFDNFFGSNRKISISRELTKLYEETLRGSIKEMVAIYSNKKPKGEYVIILQGKGK